MTQLSPEIRALVLASRPALEPTADELARGRARFVAAMAAGTVVATTTTATTASAGAGGVATTAATTTALKVGALIVGVGAVFGGGALVVDRQPRSALPVHVAPAPAPVAMPSPDPAPIVVPIAVPAPAIDPTPIPAPAVASTTKRPRRIAADPAPDPAPDPDPVPDTDPDADPDADPDPDPVPVAPSQLSIELSLLDGARRAIRASDLTTARALLVEHRRRFPNGQLAAERTRIVRTLASSTERTSP